MNINESPEDDIDSLVAQLKSNNSTFKKYNNHRIEVNSENLEEFIMKSSGSLIQDSLEVIQNIKEYTNLTPDAREAESMAELIKASTGALETLNKILLQQKKNDNQIKIKQMDVDAKQGIALAEQQTKILLSREEVMAQLIKNSEAIDITSQEDTLSK